MSAKILPIKKLSPKKLKERKALVLEVIKRLEIAYPLAECSLDYTDAWQLLVGVRLAAQCTDARVNVVTAELFKLYPTISALAGATVAQIEAIVKPCGLGHSKAKDISACMKILHEDYADQIPTTFEEILALPGVGRKSANLIVGDVFHQPAIVTDTHCIRLCNKIGLVDDLKEPLKVEKALWEIVPENDGSDLCHRFVLHGRAVCMARGANCKACTLKDICKTGKTIV